MKSKIALSIFLILIFSFVSVAELKAVSYEDVFSDPSSKKKKVVMSYSGGDNKEIKLYDNLDIEIITYDTKATSQYRYKTIGFTVTRCKEEKIDDGSDPKYKRNRYNFTDYVDDNNKKQWIEFSLKSANVAVETETTYIQGVKTEINTWTIPGVVFEKMIGNMYPDWLQALKEIIKDNKKTYYMGEALRADSIMTVVHHQDGKDKVKGVLDDSGNGRVVASGLTYWNVSGMRCGHCSDDALFSTSLYDGYPAYDVNHLDKNIKQNERICWKCAWQ